jgi:MFS family permease
LVGREHIIEGNAKLQVSQSAAQVSGPALSGLLVQVIGAATSVLATAFGFLASALFLLRIRTVEPMPVRGERRGMPAEIAEGLRFVLHQPTLRAITFCTGTSNLFFSISNAAMLLFLIRQLGLSTGVAGLLMSAAGVGAVVGGLTAARLARVFGQARIIWLSQLVAGPFAVLMPLAEPGWSVSLFAVSGLAWGFGAIVYNVAQVSYRQAICPDHLLGRMNASVRFLVWGTLPIGGLIGGGLATWLTPRGALWVGAVGGILAVGWLLASPLRTMRDLPTSQVI